MKILITILVTLFLAYIATFAAINSISYFFSMEVIIYHFICVGVGVLVTLSFLIFSLIYRKNPDKFIRVYIFLFVLLFFLFGILAIIAFLDDPFPGLQGPLTTLGSAIFSLIIAILLVVYKERLTKNRTLTQKNN